MFPSIIHIFQFILNTKPLTITSDTLEALEQLIFDAKGDALLIFAQQSESDAETEASTSESGSRKRKCPDDDSKTVTMLVSSKQMILTSPVFEAMLGDDRFKEGADLLADDKVDIELPEDDPVAFAIKTARAQVFSEGFAALNGFLERVTEPRSHCDDQDDVCGISWFLSKEHGIKWLLATST